MYRKNFMISVTVFSATPPTRVPERFAPVSKGTTHFVDLIEVSRGDASIPLQIYLEGIFDPVSQRFTFTDKARNILVPLFTEAFSNPSKMLCMVEGIVALHISAE